jgi:hypothetical protein
MRTSGAKRRATLELIRARFGLAVADSVDGGTDKFQEAKLNRVDER